MISKAVPQTPFNHCLYWDLVGNHFSNSVVGYPAGSVPADSPASFLFVAPLINRFENAAVGRIKPGGDPPPHSAFVRACDRSAKTREAALRNPRKPAAHYPRSSIIMIALSSKSSFCARVILRNFHAHVIRSAISESGTAQDVKPFSYRESQPEIRSYSFMNHPPSELMNRRKPSGFGDNRRCRTRHIACVLIGSHTDARFPALSVENPRHRRLLKFPLCIYPGLRPAENQAALGKPRVWDGAGLTERTKNARKTGR